MISAMSGGDDERIVREVEERILDQEYRHFRLIYRNDDVAIPALLMNFGDQVRWMMHDGDVSADSHKQTRMDSLAAGLGHCFKWIAAEPEHTLLLDDNSPDTVAREAGELMDWGARYHDLYLDHVAFSRGEKGATVNPESKTIEFRYRERFDPFFLLAQQADEYSFGNSYFSAMPVEELKAEFRSWSGARRTALQPRADGLPSLGPGTPAHEAAARWADETIWQELGTETQLGGFTLGEFRQVFAGLLVNCAFIAWLEDVRDSRRGRPAGPSRVVKLRHGRMIEWLAEVGGVTAASAGEILSELTLDTTRQLPSLAYQAFVRSKSDTVYLLPRFIFYSDAARTLTQSLNTGRRRRAFEALHGRITEAQLERIARRFAAFGLDVLADRRLRYGGVERRPDLIVYDRERDYLLVADYKSMINPVGPAQAISNIMNIRKHVDKVTEYVRLVASDLSVLRRKMPALSEAPTIAGLLLFRDPAPLPLEPGPTVALANWFSLGNHLSSGGYEGLPRLIEWARGRPDLGISPGSYRLEDFRVGVGGWNYVSEKIVREIM